MDLKLSSLNFSIVKRRIWDAAQKAGCSPDAITLLAVSKGQSCEKIREIYYQGQFDFGENYVQELVTKIKEFNSPQPPLNLRGGKGELQIKWHFIGHLQRRKVKDVVGQVEYIHSLDSLPLAQAINGQAEKLGIKQKCLIQVNIAEEKTKSGLSPSEVHPFLEKLAPLMHLEIMGLMALPPYFEDPEKVRPYFQYLRKLKEQLNLPLLSMGMSSDFEIAIEEGANIIRIGTALFGERSLLTNNANE
ncbi:MAG: YggS family pyridoxal phosphate enzyme [Deltaproteobacteria bacterium RIFCSPLOWO2_12_FULL_40_28]|nr:MAG: YggS family pyridoxal phosphate enzyme [Deltaproteobacteria bacterium RIFCSPHIGHO2_02_FULL_40_28]OGQ18805.1 MAG: YggS family pyridoxal phosphate enzyme [Deltaproteobacteria bacterium RIFCSPHIGHO2_12_FULL_40_32]OGQ40050.1 MAG: YggS family pyridoxal phosphate enzyme [Deltaproteobacteria bacterium RIFCSPLOWO2_02_FULL_40_36]OGQ53233.1 MAG: YggS family pyridoxal phosphate enzyme [Deltaproteobacteria bacterium RIFCSPLOWO2_12_FULL_40_28]